MWSRVADSEIHSLRDFWDNRKFVAGKMASFIIMLFMTKQTKINKIVIPLGSKGCEFCLYNVVM